VEAGKSVSLNASGSTDEDGNHLTYTWTAPNGQTVSGEDKAIITFNAPDVAAATQYQINLTVSDGELSSSTSYTLNVQPKQASGGQTGTYPTWT
ncbi:PKD domain-containing protein, partial [Escherichia coli]|uniref:PKD domain-containing protein n=2 Tax=Enterobacteriaceae TaxID=543 RepID=UPI0021B6D54D